MATNLQFIKSHDITSSVANLSVTDCFNSQYEEYKIIGQINSSGGFADANLQFIDTSGNVETGSDYEFGMLILKSETSGAQFRGTSQSSIVAQMNSGENGSANVLNVYNPFSSSSFTFTTVEKGVSFSSGLRAYKMVGVHKLAESMSGFKLTFDENATSGRISVYGVL